MTEVRTDEDQGEEFEIDDLVQEQIAHCIIEGILDGRIDVPLDEMEFSQLTDVGLELGLVVEMEDGSLELSRDVEVAEKVGLALSQEMQEQGLELGNIPVHDMNKKVFGSRYKTARDMLKRGAENAKTVLMPKVGGATATPQRNIAGGIMNVARKTGGAISRNPGTTATLLGAGVGGALLKRAFHKEKPNPLVANAEARNKK